jgi:hypothetical protein
VVYLILGVLFFCGGFGSLFFEPALHGMVFGAAGAYLLYHGSRTLRAMRVLARTPASA